MSFNTLVKAIKENDIDTFEATINSISPSTPNTNLSINSKNVKGISFIEMACFYRSDEIVNYLLDKGCKVENPMQLAELNSGQVRDLDIQEPGDFRKNKGYNNIVATLKSRFNVEKVQEYNPFFASVKMGDIDEVKRLASDPSVDIHEKFTLNKANCFTQKQFSVLDIAIENTDVKMFKTLIDLGVKPDASTILALNDRIILMDRVIAENFDKLISSTLQSRMSSSSSLADGVIGSLSNDILGNHRIAYESSKALGLTSAGNMSSIQVVNSTDDAENAKNKYYEMIRVMDTTFSPEEMLKNRQDASLIDNNQMKELRDHDIAKIKEGIKVVTNAFKKVGSFITNTYNNLVKSEPKVEDEPIEQLDSAQVLKNMKGIRASMKAKTSDNGMKLN